MALREMRSINNLLPGTDITKYEDYLKEPIIEQCLVSYNPRKVQNAINVLTALNIKIDDIVRR